MNKNKQNLKETCHFKAHRQTITLLAGLMFIFFSMSFVSCWEFDNLKSYDEETKTITITNSFLKVYPLGEVAKIKLDTPIINYVVRGEDKLVAEFTIDNFETYTEGVFDDMDFYNTKNNMNKFDRDFTYKYKTFKEVEVDDFNYFCEGIGEYDLDGEEVKNCDYKKVGSHNEIKDVWNDFNKEISLPKGRITIGIFTDVYAGDYVEWIPTLFGVRINEWATWVGLSDPHQVGYYSNVSSIDNANDVYVSGNYAYVVGRYIFSLAVINTTDKNNPIQIGNYINATFNTMITVSGEGNYVEVGGYDFDGIAVINITDPTNPKQVGALKNASSMGGVYFIHTVENYVYVVSYDVDSLAVINITDPTNPKQVGALFNASSMDQLVSVFISDNYAYTCSPSLDTLTIINITDKTNPVQVGTLVNTTSLNTAHSVAVSGNYAYVNARDSGQMTIINITDKTNPVQVGTLVNTTSLKSTYGICVSGNYAYVNGRNVNTTSIINVTDPTNPKQVGALKNDTSLYSPIGVYFLEGYVYVASRYSDSLTIIKSAHEASPPNLIINTPTNTTYATNLITFNVTVTDDSLIDSCEYTLNSGVTNYTLTNPTYVDDYTHTNSTMSQGSHTVAFYCNDTLNNINNSESVTFTIDTINPPVTITSPTGQIDSHVFGNNLSVNWTISDTHLDSCWLDYNSANTTLTCGDNNFSFIPVINEQSLIIWANDTSGNIAFNTTSWTYNFLENNATFNATSYETSQETFVLNMTTDLTVLSIDSVLNYNGTEYSSTASCSGGECLLSNTFDLQLISAASSELHTFFWNFTIFNGTDSIETISSSRIQNVSVIHLEQCNATYPTKTLNFTVYDEQNLSRFSQFQFDGTFDFWIGSGSVKKNSSFSKNITEMNLCLSPNTTIKIDAIIDYDEVINKSYTNRFYYFDAYPITNTLQHIKMYLLKSASSTSFILKVQDENLLPVADALIEIHRYYPGEGIYRIVQIAKTDDNGKSIGFFQTENVDYKFIIKKNGETLLTTGKQKVIPEVSPFTLTFNTGADLGEPWSSQADIPSLESSLSFDADTGIVTYIYVDSSTNFTQARLLVQEQSLVNSTAYAIICNDTSTLSSATMTCSVGNESGFYIASSYITRTGEALDLQITFQIEDFSSVAGFLGLFFGWFLILIASFMFKFNEIAGIWATTVTIFLVNLMGLIKFGGVFVTAIIGIAIILTWLMEK